METLQNERDEAAAAGQHGDWWVGERRKGVGPEEQQTFKEARRLLKESGAGWAERLGSGMLGLDNEMEWADVGFEEDIEEADLAGLGDGGEGGAEQGGVEGGRGVDLADEDEEMLEASEPVFAGEGVEELEELEGMDFD